MSVRLASVVVGNAAAASEIIRSWREYYCNGGLGQLLSPRPRQTRLNITVNKQPMEFRASGFTLDGVMVLVANTSGYSVVFFDQSLNKGQGGFLPAFAVLSIAERTRLGARRRVREQFLRELIAAARQHQKPQPAKTTA